MPITLNTPNYNFNTPIEGGDDDIWGGSLNDNWTALDGLLKTIKEDLEQQIEDAIEAARIKVGDLYFSGDATDPAAKLGYGVWQQQAQGRAIVGVGNNGQSEWTLGQHRGSETHTLTAGEMPVHAHAAGDLRGTTNSAGLHQHAGGIFGFPTLAGGSPINFSSTPGSLHRSGGLVQPDGSHTHFVQMSDGSTSPAGSGAAHNNVQPSIGVYVWLRTE